MPYRTCLYSLRRHYPTSPLGSRAHLEQIPIYPPFPLRTAACSLHDWELPPTVLLPVAHPGCWHQQLPLYARSSVLLSSPSDTNDTLFITHLLRLKSPFCRQVLAPCGHGKPPTPPTDSPTCPPFQHGFRPSVCRVGNSRPRDVPAQSSMFGACMHLILMLFTFPPVFCAALFLFLRLYHTIVCSRPSVHLRSALPAVLHAARDASPLERRTLLPD